MQSIDNALIRQFRDSLHIEAQQMVSKAMPFVEFKTFQGDDLAYDSFGKVNEQEVESRNQKIEFAEAEFSRRKLKRRRFNVAVPVDASDVRGMLLDPTGPITKACIAAMNRRKDRIVTEAALADVLTGRDFGTTVTFAGDGGQEVDATAGFTYEKLLEVRRQFKAKDVPSGKIGLLMSDQEEEALMKETELTSGDFTRMMPVDGGDLTRGVGMDFVIFGSSPDGYDPILNINGSSERECIAIAATQERAGICLGMSSDITVKIQERTDLIETTQVVVGLELGAVRTEGVLVQKIRTTPV